MGFWSYISKIAIIVIGAIISLAVFFPLFVMSLSFRFGGVVGSDLFLFIGLQA